MSHLKCKMLVTSMQLELNKTFFDAIFIDENHTLSEKRRKPQKSRVACGSLA